MRKLITSDVFKLSRILKNMDLETVIKPMIQKGEKIGSEDEEKVQELGVDVVFALIGSASNEKIENDIYSLLGDITEKKSEDIKSQSIETTIEDIKKIVSENNIKNFFNSAGRLIQN